MREWARMGRRLGELPVLRGAVLSGEIGWSVPGRVIGLTTPDTEEAGLATVRGRTLRAVVAIVAAVREAEANAGVGHAPLPPAVCGGGRCAAAGGLPAGAHGLPRPGDGRQHDDGDGAAWGSTWWSAGWWGRNPLRWMRGPKLAHTVLACVG